MEYNIKTPITKEEAAKLRAGDTVLITGVIYGARDAAHARMAEVIEYGAELPFELKGNIIYYVGPTPARAGYPIGAAGPTTSGRMDKYTPKLLDLGLGGMIGKGKRSREVLEGIVKNGAVYMAAVGGAAALIAQSVKSSEIIAYPELGTEAVRKMYVENFPAIVVADSSGNNLYESAPMQYNREKN